MSVSRVEGRLAKAWSSADGLSRSRKSGSTDRSEMGGALGGVEKPWKSEVVEEAGEARGGKSEREPWAGEEVLAAAELGLVTTGVETGLFILEGVLTAATEA